VSASLPADLGLDAQAPVQEFCGRISRLPAATLGALVYGGDASAQVAAAADARLVAVPLEALAGSHCIEAWVTRGPVTCGMIEGLHFSASADHLFGYLEVDEAQAGGLRHAARDAYRQLLRFHAHGEHRQLWRIWNFVDAINEGDGDAERYRQFCLGRAEGIGSHLDGYPAGTAVGTRTGARRLQLVWLAGRVRGLPVENPRQLSAFRYPRQYGPASPSFSRAMRLGDQLLISGTSSILGHETVHDGDLTAQLRESVSNLQTVARAAGMGAARLSGLKAYVRRAADLAPTGAQLRPPLVPEGAACVLAADICRRDLLIELEAVALAAAPAT
jgi:chorismate lyase/3-hydroxybenzoate synthase